tara:strand:+ start:487 stop:666 length:180 start_codon:yes stop_codon:yes gene_type:complete
MPKEFRVFAECTSYYEYTYKTETKEEATALAEKNLHEDFPLYEELSNDKPKIYDTTEIT